MHKPSQVYTQEEPLPTIRALHFPRPYMWLLAIACAVITSTQPLNLQSLLRNFFNILSEQRKELKFHYLCVLYSQYYRNMVNALGIIITVDSCEVNGSLHDVSELEPGLNEGAGLVIGSGDSSSSSCIPTRWNLVVDSNCWRRATSSVGHVPPGNAAQHPETKKTTMYQQRAKKNPINHATILIYAHNFRPFFSSSYSVQRLIYGIIGAFPRALPNA